MCGRENKIERERKIEKERARKKRYNGYVNISIVGKHRTENKKAR